ncbi:hypothetical protein SAMN05421837_107370 [Amycolatopsis pretoriensis]|uniref:Uncharacterized protein n=1 Tax=Amycolatopsis pretoriensis TaxID=218821 RepID=A0A1H5R7V7_9PSEU|nr:phage gp6-like head-tail connector protein [Amycolatopsis pretoriensis]SEF34399.1 hypothetical protein SAMN05421837_107370 [Amycolatopsis pretoriensis]
MAIDVGDLYRCSFTLTSPAGGNVNAGTMTLTITLPDQTTTVVGPVAPTTTGVYVYDYQTVQAGRHTAHWVGTGANPGAYVEVFDVRPADAPYLVSLADIKAQTNISNTVSDEELRTYLEAATGVIERHLGQAVVRRSRTEEHLIPSGGGLVLNWTPVVSVTSLATVDGSYTWNPATLYATPAGLVTCPLGTAPYGHVAVTYVAGTSLVPEEYGLAARIIVQHLWETQRGAAGAPRAGGLGDTLGISRSAGSGLGYAIPNRALELLGTGLPGVA